MRKVKRFKNGFILDPFTVGPSNTLQDLDDIKAPHAVGVRGGYGKVGFRLGLG